MNILSIILVLMSVWGGRHSNKIAGPSAVVVSGKTSLTAPWFSPVTRFLDAYISRRQLATTTARVDHYSPHTHYRKKYRRRWECLVFLGSAITVAVMEKWA
ncbi:hypothetical protein Hamer_G022279 [Homarus americanus]|uniref:Secreted protein n=1 Tax=Homarus americanus TaxID=6706 RepID=A0A8J5JQB5_HOMAM|nr:hypothetical protein Hamer_G022279 [Homarus americanus]